MNYWKITVLYPTVIILLVTKITNILQQRIAPSITIVMIGPCLQIFTGIKEFLSHLLHDVEALCIMDIKWRTNISYVIWMW